MRKDISAEAAGLGALSRPIASGPGISLRMSRQRRIGTEPELALRRALHSRGHRFRIGYPVPSRGRRTMDVAFTRVRVAVFVDGCFWHACPQHATAPRSNAGWWDAKLRRNVERDRDTDAALEAAGWHVIRIWEHEETVAAVAKVEHVLAARSGAPKFDGPST